MIHNFDLIFTQNNIHIFPIDTSCLYQLLLKQDTQTFSMANNHQTIDYDIMLLLSSCSLSEFIECIKYFDLHDTAYFFRLIMKANSIHYKHGDLYDCSQVFLNRLELFQEYDKLNMLFKSIKIPFIKSLIKDSNYNYQYLLSISFEKWLALFYDDSIFIDVIKSIKEKYYFESVLNDSILKDKIETRKI